MQKDNAGASPVMGMIEQIVEDSVKHTIMGVNDIDINNIIQILVI